MAVGFEPVGQGQRVAGLVSRGEGLFGADLEIIVADAEGVRPGAFGNQHIAGHEVPLQEPHLIGCDVGRARHPLHDGRPAVLVFAAHPGGVEACLPGIDAGDVILDGRIGMIVVVQGLHGDPVEVAHIHPDVCSGAVVELVVLRVGPGDTAGPPYCAEQ